MFETSIPTTIFAFLHGAKGSADVLVILLHGVGCSITNSAHAQFSRVNPTIIKEHGGPISTTTLFRTLNQRVPGSSPPKRAAEDLSGPETWVTHRT